MTQQNKHTITRKVPMPKLRDGMLESETAIQEWLVHFREEMTRQVLEEIPGVNISQEQVEKIALEEMEKITPKLLALFSSREKQSSPNSAHKSAKQVQGTETLTPIELRPQQDKVLRTTEKKVL